MKERSKIFKMIALISQIGITMLSSIFICGLAGYLIDQRFGTHIFLVMLILGIAGGYAAVYKLLKNFIKAKPEIEASKDEETLRRETILNDRMEELQRNIYDADKEYNHKE